MFTSILHLLSTLTAVMTVLAPFPYFWRIYKTQSTDSVSVLPVILIFCSCYTWVMYARLVNSIFPLFVTYGIGMLASIAFGGIYYHWTHDHARIHKLFGLAFYVLAGYTFYYSLGTSGASNQSDNAVKNTLGVLSGVVNLALYASPLETVKDVIEKRDASTIPIIISVIFLMNSVIWVLYSKAEDDLLVLVPNAIGLALCVIQVVLYLMYYPRRVVDAQPTQSQHHILLRQATATAISMRLDSDHI
ncbi:MtN3-like protein [Phytophthora palmivora]|uniref:Sugar transporter SWEET1 n=1 Tax=Phytophthora palmivora TaxID=4796 RepID=A0A2P4XFL8_9STRA|nr:MtN3-like protein [Phytophthora palmivora]